MLWQCGHKLFFILYILIHWPPPFKKNNSNAHVDVNPVPLRLTQGILKEKRVVCQNPHAAISFHCQNTLPEDIFLPFCPFIMSEWCQKNVLLSESPVCSSRHCHMLKWWDSLWQVHNMNTAYFAPPPPTILINMNPCYNLYFSSPLLMIFKEIALSVKWWKNKQVSPQAKLSCFN